MELLNIQDGEYSVSVTKAGDNFLVLYKGPGFMVENPQKDADEAIKLAYFYLRGDHNVL
jgi:hypothetical protein